MTALNLFRFRTFLSGVIGLLILVCLLLFAAQAAGCSNALAVGYRSVLVVRNAGDATSKALATAAQAKREACKAKHQIKTIEYAECIEPTLKALEAWRLYVKPSLNTSLAAAFGVLEVARARKEKKAPWLDALKPGACALVMILPQWAALMPKDVKSLVALLQGVKGLVCK